MAPQIVCSIVLLIVLIVGYRDRQSESFLIEKRFIVAECIPAVFIVVMAIHELLEQRRLDWWWFILILILLLKIRVDVIEYRTPEQARRRAKEDYFKEPNICPMCAFDLRGSRDAFACPECGWQIPKVFDRDEDDATSRS